MSKRDDNRRDKRQLIVDAARALMQAGDTEGFSMRTLAEEAGVSIATPYNLFGSKEQVVAAVMDTDLARYREALNSADKDPLELLFHSISIGRQLFEAEPHFYKMGAQSIQGATDSSLTTQFSLPRHQLLRDLVQQAVQTGYLTHRINSDSLAIALGHQYYGWIQAWARDLISLDEMETRSHYAYAMTLAAAATDDYREALINRAMTLQKSLPEAGFSNTNHQAAKAG